jgi:hypothetical protein
MRRARLLGVAILLLAAACDPGWEYRVSSVQRAPERLPGYQIGAVTGSLFTSRLTIRFDVRNVGGESLPIDPGRVRAWDAGGRMLPEYPGLVRGSWVLGKGEARGVGSSFLVEPVAGPFSRPNRELRTVIVAIEGVGRPGSSAVRVKLDWPLD